MTALSKRTSKASTNDLTDTLNGFPPKSTSNVRVTITGSGTVNWDISYLGTSFRNGLGNGYNWGAYSCYGTTGTDQTAAFDFSTAVAQAVADGVKIVRVVGYNRWFGSYQKSSGADSRISAANGSGSPPFSPSLIADDNCYAARWPSNWADLKACVRALTNAGIWVIIAHDSDIGQSGTQDSTTSNFGRTYYNNTVYGGEVPPNSAASWDIAGGYNYFTSTYLRAQLFRNWLTVVEEFRTYPFIWAYELLSEPMPNTGTVTFNNPTGYTSAWSTDGPDGVGGARWGITRLYRALIAMVRQIDTVTPFIVGARDGYDLKLIGEIIMSERTDCIYTYDRLDGGASGDYLGTGGAIENGPLNCPSVAQSSTLLNVPTFINQLGCKDSSDPGYLFTAANLLSFKSWGIPYCWWDDRDNQTSTTGYGLRYNPSNDGVTFVTKPGGKLALFSTQLAYTGAALEAAAIAACQSASGTLFYVKQNFSNVFASQASGGTAITTKNGTQSVLWMNPVDDTGASGLTLQQTTTLAGPLVTTLDPGLYSAYPVMQFDGANKYLMGFIGGSQSGYWTTTSGDQTVIVSGCLAVTTSGAQNLFEVGNNTGLVTYPQLQCASTHLPKAIYTDATNTGTINGASPTNQQNFAPMVYTCTKATNTKTMYINGNPEPIAGPADTTVLLSVPNTRLRVGANTSNGGFYTGWIGLVFVAKTAISTANRQAIERFAAYQMGIGYYF